jgi:peroxiredoxin
MRLLIVCALLGALLLTGCTGIDPKVHAAEVAKALAKEGILPLDLGTPAPAFTATAHDGTRVTIPPLAQASAEKATATETVSSESAAGNALSTQRDNPEVPPPVEESTASAEPATEPTAGNLAVGGPPGKTLLFFYVADNTPNSTRNLQDLTKARAELEAAGYSVYGISVGTAGEHAAFAQAHGITIPLLADTGSIAASYGAGKPDGGLPQRTVVGIAADGSISYYLRGWLPPAQLLEALTLTQ